jgi:hypothetical protein
MQGGIVGGKVSASSSISVSFSKLKQFISDSEAFHEVLSPRCADFTGGNFVSNVLQPSVVKPVWTVGVAHVRSESSGTLCGRLGHRVWWWAGHDDGTPDISRGAIISGAGQRILFFFVI